MPISSHLARFALDIFDCGAVQIAEPPSEGFTLHVHEILPQYARRAPIYIETDKFSEELQEQSARYLAEKIQTECKINIEKIGRVGGVPDAGTPFAEKLADLLGKEPIKFEKSALARSWRAMREDVKKHRHEWHPLILKGPKTLLVENLITSGDSVCMAAWDEVRKGRPVMDVVSIFDWNGGAAKRLYKNPFRINIHSLFSLPDLFDFYRAAGRVSPALANLVEYFSMFLQGAPI